MPTASQSFAVLLAASTISMMSYVFPFWELATVEEVDECQGSLWETGFKDPSFHGLKTIVEATKEQVVDVLQGTVASALMTKLMPFVEAVLQELQLHVSFETWEAWQLEMRCAGLTTEFLVIVALLLLPIVAMELTIFALLCSKCFKSRGKDVEAEPEADLKVGELREEGKEKASDRADEKASDGADEKTTSDEEGASGAHGGA